MSYLPKLKLSKTVLVLFNLDIPLQQFGPPNRLMQRSILEIIARNAQTTDCRILDSFRSDHWLRRLYATLDHLLQSGYITSDMQGYDLTEQGRDRASSIELTNRERKNLLCAIAMARKKAGQ